MTGAALDARGARQRAVKSWWLLCCAIILEVLATSLLPATESFTRLVPSVVVVILYAFTYLLLSRCLEHIPLGVAYAVWSGAGTAAVAAIGIVVWGEEASVLKGVAIILIIVGVVAINLPERAKPATDTGKTTQSGELDVL